MEYARSSGCAPVYIASQEAPETPKEVEEAHIVLLDKGNIRPKIRIDCHLLPWKSGKQRVLLNSKIVFAR